MPVAPGEKVDKYDDIEEESVDNRLIMKKNTKKLTNLEGE